MPSRQRGKNSFINTRTAINQAIISAQAVPRRRSPVPKCGNASSEPAYPALFRYLRCLKALGLPMPERGLALNSRGTKVVVMQWFCYLEWR